MPMNRPPLLLPAVGAVLLALALGCASGDGPTPTVAASAPTAAPSPTAASTAATPAPATVERPLYQPGPLTDADLADRSLRELALMRNTIFARVGHPFVKPWLDSYFRQQPWYEPAAKADLSRLTQADRDNVQRIADAEAAISRTELLARRAKLQAQPTLSDDDQVELGLLSAALGEWSGDDSVPMEQRNPLQDPTVLSGQLTTAQLEGLSRRDLRLLRNTVFARYGRAFESDVLQVYFADKAWYKPDPAYDDGLLTEVDKRNIQLIQSMEDRLGGPLSEWEHAAEEGWFAGA